MTADDHKGLSATVRDAGFFTTTLEDMGGWRRTCVCSKRRPAGGYTGNSFWVARVEGDWHLGAWWGPCVYRLPRDRDVAEFCVAWLSRKPDGVECDFDDVQKAAFDLEPVNWDDFNLLVECL